jgi:hypothetical protein
MGFEPYLRHLQAGGAGGKIRDDVKSVTVRLCGVLHSRQIVDEQDVCSLLESNLVVAQGQRHRAGRDTTIQIRLIENVSDLRRPMRNGVAGRALQAFPGFSHGISHAT